MTLEQVKTEAIAGALIKSLHIGTIVDSVSANNINIETLSAMELSISSNIVYASLNISATANNALVVSSEKKHGFLGNFSISSVSAGAFQILNSASEFSTTAFIQITSKAVNVNFYIGNISSSVINVLAKDTNGSNATIYTNEGFVFRIEK